MKTGIRTSCGVRLNKGTNKYSLDGNVKVRLSSTQRIPVEEINFRITEDSDFRILENGDFRILE